MCCECISVLLLLLLSYHVHHLRVDGLGDDVAVVGDVLHHLAERRPLDLLPFEVAKGVGHKVEQHTTLTQLLDKKLLLLGRGQRRERRRDERRGEGRSPF